MRQSYKLMSPSYIVKLYTQYDIHTVTTSLPTSYNALAPSMPNAFLILIWDLVIESKIID